MIFHSFSRKKKYKFLLHYSNFYDFHQRPEHKNNNAYEKSRKKNFPIKKFNLVTEKTQNKNYYVTLKYIFL